MEASDMIVTQQHHQVFLVIKYIHKLYIAMYWQKVIKYFTLALFFTKMKVQWHNHWYQPSYTPPVIPSGKIYCLNNFDNKFYQAV